MSKLVDYSAADIIDCYVPDAYLVEVEVDCDDNRVEYLGLFFDIDQVSNLVRRIYEKDFATVNPLPDFVDHLLGVMVDPAVCSLDASCEEVVEAMKEWAEGINDEVTRRIQEKSDAQADGSWWED